MLEPISIATAGYVCGTGPASLSIATDGYVCLDVIIGPTEPDIGGGGSGGHGAVIRLPGKSIPLEIRQNEELLLALTAVIAILEFDE